MDRQLFATGQVVAIAPGSLSGPSTGDRYKIVRRYPVENRRSMYHVRSLADGDQRMVPEDELAVVMPTAHDWAMSRKVLRLFPEVIPFARGPGT
jgi:hypothetical protein